MPLLLAVPVGLLGALAAAWGALALYFQLPGPPAARLAGAAVWLLATAALLGLALFRTPWWLLAYLLLFGGLLGWWTTLAPAAHREWADDVAQTTHGEIRDDRVTLHNVRNFEWRSREDYTPRWETREFDLSGLRTVDVALSYWMKPTGIGPAIAHTLVSFGFADGEHLVFSVEIRKEKHESFSAIGGFFKQFETSVVAADERDILRVRSNVRGEDVYLYRVHMQQATMRSLFEAYVEEANQLARTPRFYDTLTANCTTIVYQMMARLVDGLPMDYRLILSGYLPEYIHRLGAFEPGYGLDTLRARGRIAERARAADGAPDFSARIREGVPGYPSQGDGPTAPAH